MPEDKSSSAIDLLNQLCDIMENRDLAEVYLREGEVTLRIRRGEVSISPIFAPPSAQAPNESGELIKSPMPGMFYRGSSPEEPPFVEAGAVVSEEETLCLIEAMKIFNEVKPDFPCEILEILVENATPVEFDQPLFRIKKS